VLTHALPRTKSSRHLPRSGIVRSSVYDTEPSVHLFLHTTETIDALVSRWQSSSSTHRHIRWQQQQKYARHVRGCFVNRHDQTHRFSEGLHLLHGEHSRHPRVSQPQTSGVPPPHHNYRQTPLKDHRLRNCLPLKRARLQILRTTLMAPPAVTPPSRPQTGRVLRLHHNHHQTPLNGIRPSWELEMK
jgi:hypothetical protein